MSLQSHHSRPRGLSWTAVWLSAILELVIAVPTLAVEESWHGRPMIDQPNSLWLIAAGLAALAFLAGGALAGYRLPAAAATHATVAAGLAVAVLLVAALSRRLWLAHEGVSASVGHLWFFGGVAALLLSVIGSGLGRRLALRGR